MYVKGAGSMCVLVEHVKDNYYAKFIILPTIATEKYTLVF